MDGFIIINKDKGLTSYDICHKLKRILGTKHVGHTGTLDPDATGVLVVAFNKATKLMKLLEEHSKEYTTTVLFGKSSDTLDITGKILEDVVCDINYNELIIAIDKIKSYTEQVPPMYSAIKVNGQKMYDLARQNKTVDLPPRPITINKIDILSDLYDINGYKAIDLHIDVSKGFYVRSFCRDLGMLLGVPSLMYSLQRDRSGVFDIKDSCKLDDDVVNHILGIEDVFKDLEILNVNDFEAKLCLNGVVFDERQIKTDKPFRIYHNDKLIAIYEPVDTYKYKPVVLFKGEE